jgi:hypothetical protein
MNLVFEKMLGEPWTTVSPNVSFNAPCFARSQNGTLHVASGGQNYNSRKNYYPTYTFCTPKISDIPNFTPWKISEKFRKIQLTL